MVVDLEIQHADRYDEDVIRAADYLIDMGPGAGLHGGRIIAQDTPSGLIGLLDASATIECVLTPAADQQPVAAATLRALPGVTGAVGQEFLSIIEQRHFPFASLKVLASSRSARSDHGHSADQKLSTTTRPR